MKQPAVYMMANKPNGTIYIGVTSELRKRAFEHHEGLVEGFTKRYSCKNLVWFELHNTMESAILRETALKDGSRQKKVALIVKDNPQWLDLVEQF